MEQQGVGGGDMGVAQGLSGPNVPLPQQAQRRLWSSQLRMVHSASNCDGVSQRATKHSTGAQCRAQQPVHAKKL